MTSQANSIKPISTSLFSVIDYTTYSCIKQYKALKQHRLLVRWVESAIRDLERFGPASGECLETTGDLLDGLYGVWESIKGLDGDSALEEIISYHYHITETYNTPHQDKHLVKH